MDHILLGFTDSKLSNMLGLAIFFYFYNNTRLVALLNCNL